jgi:hypothetical protein
MCWQSGTRGRRLAVLAGLPLAAAGLIVFQFLELHPFGALGVLVADQTSQ